LGRNGDGWTEWGGEGGTGQLGELPPPVAADKQVPQWTCPQTVTRPEAEWDG
jgi:hypothetical protein